ncbi:hypothetical protein NDU88_001263 [Pleurodeles waltl]|uniref:Uncharacterized protein n=1 Tax=Pleurodeles waltl TaxID=8319 RepID=A0AAV7MK08_PLEWA|nr:hypothetical protein NDU88_001263 [Pleurodeles waltl]
MWVENCTTAQTEENTVYLCTFRAIAVRRQRCAAPLLTYCAAAHAGDTAQITAVWVALSGAPTPPVPGVFLAGRPPRSERRDPAAAGARALHGRLAARVNLRSSLLSAARLSLSARSPRPSASGAAEQERGGGPGRQESLLTGRCCAASPVHGGPRSGAQRRLLPSRSRCPRSKAAAPKGQRLSSSPVGVL